MFYFLYIYVVKYNYLTLNIYTYIYCIYDIYDGCIFLNLVVYIYIPYIRYIYIYIVRDFTHYNNTQNLMQKLYIHLFLLKYKEFIIYNKICNK